MTTTHDEIAELLGEGTTQVEPELETTQEETQATPTEQEDVDEDVSTGSEEKSEPAEEESDSGDSTGEPTDIPDTPVDDHEDTAGDQSVAERIAQLEARNAALLKQLEEVARGPARQEPEFKPSAKFDSSRYAKVFDKLDLDSVIDTEESFKGFMLKLAEAIHTDVTEQVLPQIPAITQDQLSRHATMQQIKDQFYRDHEELLPVQSYVAQVANAVAKENPEMSLQEVLEKTAETAKTALGLEKVKQSKREAKEKKPAFVKPGKAERSKPADKVDPLQKEIQELIDL
jgi:hypothetical protein